jgi:hypothetical protein
VKTVGDAEIGVVVELFDGPAVVSVLATVDGALSDEIPDETTCETACLNEAS